MITSQKRQKKFPLRTFNCSLAQGDLLQRLSQDRKLVVNLSSNYVLTRERKSIDINPVTFSQSCFAVSKFMIRLLRHDKNIPREDDGAVRFDDLIEEFKVKFVATLQRTVAANANRESKAL